MYQSLQPQGACYSHTPRRTHTHLTSFAFVVEINFTVKGISRFRGERLRADDPTPCKGITGDPTSAGSARVSTASVFSFHPKFSSSASVIMPEYPTSTADFSTRLTSLRAPRPRPRPRHSRVRTGCRECRERRVKCAEGEATSLGKMACRQCWETCSDCWYPDPDDRKQWVPALTTRQTPTAERLDLPDPEEERGQWLHDQATTDSIIAAAMDPSPGPGPHSHSSSRALSALFDSLHNSAVVIRTMAPSAVFQGQLLYPAPAIPLSTFTLAALSSATVDRAALSYFEVTGCNEIVAAPNSRSNWIYTVLFPRLYSLLSGSRPDHRGEAAVHDFVHHSLLRLSLVHRGNMEQNEEKAAEYKTQAARHRRAAVYATLKARMGYPEEAWRTGIYL